MPLGWTTRDDGHHRHHQPYDHQHDGLLADDHLPCVVDATCFSLTLSPTGSGARHSTASLHRRYASHSSDLSGRAGRCWTATSLLDQTLLLLLSTVVLLLLSVSSVSADQDAKRLYEDLLTDYNRLIRPVGNNSDRLTVKLGLKLSQLIDVVINQWIFLFIIYFY